MGREDLAATYFESRAPRYTERSERGAWAWWRRRERAALWPLLDRRPGRSVLDVGCGAGYYSSRLQTEGLRVLGVDKSPAMVRAAAANGVPARCLSAHRIERLNQRFDNILLAGVLEFVAEPAPVIAACARSLEPGGRLVLLVPAPGMMGRLYEMAHACQVWVRDPVLYRELAMAAGLRPVHRRRCTPISEVMAFE